MFERLQKLNLTLSHRSVTTLVQLIGKNNDVTVKCWRDQLAEGLKLKVNDNWQASETYSCVKKLRLEIHMYERMYVILYFDL